MRKTRRWLFLRRLPTYAVPIAVLFGLQVILTVADGYRWLGLREVTAAWLAQGIVASAVGVAWGPQVAVDLSRWAKRTFGERWARYLILQNETALRTWIRSGSLVLGVLCLFELVVTLVR